MNNDAYCTYCCQSGHTKSICFKFRNTSNRNSGTSNNEGQEHTVFNSDHVSFTTITMKNNFSSDMWILDSGASYHYCQSVEGLTQLKEIDESIKIGNGDSMKATEIGN
jgi:hypothetical protein